MPAVLDEMTRAADTGEMRRGDGGEPAIIEGFSVSIRVICCRWGPAWSGLWLGPPALCESQFASKYTMQTKIMRKKGW